MLMYIQQEVGHTLIAIGSTASPRWHEGWDDGGTTFIDGDKHTPHTGINKHILVSPCLFFQYLQQNKAHHLCL